MKNVYLAWTLGLCSLAPALAQDPAPDAADGQLPPAVGLEPTDDAATEAADAPPNPGDVQGLAREEMWRAPTEEDWQKPVLIPFERTFEDALAVSRATNKPVLACVNMDGEIASEHYAGVRYRQPEVAALYEPFVCVIASVYRHTPRDYDANGERVICPRFGSVTCGEHIALEPILYDKYLDETRVAPRHVVIELDGSESRDVYYAFDTASVFDVIITSAQGRPEPTPETYWDLPLVDRTGFAGRANREALEAAFRTGSVEVRKQILQRSIETSKNGGPEQHELWRLALKSRNAELARLAVDGIATSDQPASIDLVLATLQDLELAGDREVLIQTLERIGQQSKRAKDLVASFRGLGQKSGVVDTEGASRALDVEAGALGKAAVDKLSALEHARRQGGAVYGAEGTLKSEGELALDRAGAALDLVRTGQVDKRFLGVYLEDIVADLELARPLLETDLAWRWNLVDIAYDLTVAQGVVSQVAAEDRARELVPTLPASAIAAGGTTVRDVLAAFMRARQRQITGAVTDKVEWPAEWMADAKDTFAAIKDAPTTTGWDYVQHQDFLRFMGAFGEANVILEAALERFPLDPWVHDRLRSYLIWNKELTALDGLEARYAALVAGHPEAPTMNWFAGHATRLAAEIRRRQGKLDEAVQAYDRALAYFQASIDGAVSSTASSNVERGLCLAGQARIAVQKADYPGAVAKLVESFDVGPDAAGTVDGLNQTPIMIAQTMIGRQDVPDELKERLKAELVELRAYNPRLFDLPDYEANSRGQGPVGFGGRRFSGPR